MFWAIIFGSLLVMVLIATAVGYLVYARSRSFAAGLLAAIAVLVVGAAAILLVGRGPR